MKYYLQILGKEQGPLTVEAIKGLVCNPTDFVRAEDSSEWVPVSAVKELAAETKKPPHWGNWFALASFGLGLVSVPLLYMSLLWHAPLFWLTSIPAIIFGHMALRRLVWLKRKPIGTSVAQMGLGLGYFAGVIAPVVALIVCPAWIIVSEKSNIVTSNNYCKQIVLAMKVYASDCDGRYPDADVPNARSSNDVFRELFKKELFTDETIFGCPMSPFIPDNKIGTAPDFSETLKTGENHWAMTKGLNDSSAGGMPLIFENPSEATWPPKWDASSSGKAKPGRTWSGGRINIGFNDGSVQAMKLESAKGKSVGLKPNARGETVFLNDSPQPEILNVAR